MRYFSNTTSANEPCPVCSGFQAVIYHKRQSPLGRLAIKCSKCGYEPGNQDGQHSVEGLEAIWNSCAQADYVAPSPLQAVIRATSALINACEYCAYQDPFKSGCPELRGLREADKAGKRLLAEYEVDQNPEALIQSITSYVVLAEKAFRELLGSKAIETRQAFVFELLKRIKVLLSEAKANASALQPPAENLWMEAIQRELESNPVVQKLHAMFGNAVAGLEPKSFTFVRQPRNQAVRDFRQSVLDFAKASGSNPETAKAMQEAEFALNLQLENLQVTNKRLTEAAEQSEQEIQRLRARVAELEGALRQVEPVLENALALNREMLNKL